MQRHQGNRPWTPTEKRVSEGRCVFYLLPPELAKLKAYAKREGKSVSYVVAEAVRPLLKRGKS
jgi:hypothetical protein